MKPKTSLFLFLVVAASTQLHAASGSWNTTTTGALWSTAGNWASSTIADGAGFNANFNALNITADTTVNLNASRTIGSLLFDDTTASNSWILANNGSALNVLTLSNGASKPGISVGTAAAARGNTTISLELQGTNGFQKTGLGTLTLSGGNTSLSGQVNLSNGTIVVSNNNALGTGTVNINLVGVGSGTNYTKLTLNNGITLSNNIIVDANYGNTGQVIGLDAATSSATIAGNITVNSRNLSGGTIYGSGGAGLLTITGQINSTLAAGTNNAIVVRQGGIRFSGGGSYNDIELRGGGTNITYSIGANNGIATNANVILGGNGNIIFDLNGFNQSVNGLTDFSTGNTRTITNSVAGTKTLTLTNTLNHTFGGGTATISGNLALDISLGSGITQTISSANSHNGGTTVNSGRLITTSSTLGTGGLSIASAGTYAYQPTVAQALSLGGGNLTLANGSTLGASVGGTLSQSAIAAGAATALGSVNLNIYGIPGVAVTTGTHNLVTATSGLTAGGATYTPRIYNASNFTATGFSATDTALSMGFTSATALTTEYWKGGLSGGTGVWALSNGTTASNWASDVGGTATSLTPGTNADIIFSSTGATNQSAMTLGANMSVKSLTFNDSAATTLAADGNILTLNTTSGITVNSSAGAVTLNAPIVMGGAQTWTNASTTNALTVGGFVSNGANLLTVTGAGNTAISGAIGGIGLPPAGGLTKTGTGTLTLSGNNIYSGTTTVSGGKLALTGGAINTTSVINAGQIIVGNVASTNAVLSVAGGTLNGTYTTATPSVAIGSIANAVGSLQMSSGTINTTGELHVGRGAGAYAAYSQSGGTANIGSYLVVGFNNDRAVLNHSSGGLTVASNVMTVAAGGTGSIGVANLSGGNFTSAGGVFIGENGLGTLNVSGSSIVTLGGNGVNIGRNTGSTGIVNLGGGTLNTNLVNKGSGTATFNFNGGTLQANTANATFMTGLTNAYVNTGGALIDTNGNDITIGQALLAPTGSGVTATGLTASGSGYIGTPLVTLTGGGGSGATAVANIDSNGNLLGTITMTNPGVGYTSAPTFALTGGGGTGSISGTAGTVTNVSGGLTKSGAGILTLTNTSTYTGATVVSGGTLLVNGTLGDTAVTVQSTATLGGTSGVIGSGTASVLVDSGGTLAPGSSAGTLTVNGNVTVNGTFAYEYDGGTTSGDLLDVNGTLTLNSATLSLVDLVANSYTLNDKFTLAAYNFLGVGSTFSGYADDTLYTFNGGSWLFNYNDTTAGLNGGVGTNYITITAVPEPAAMLIGSLGLLALLRRRRDS